MNKKKIYSILIILPAIIGLSFFILSICLPNSWFHTVSSLVLAESLCIIRFSCRVPRREERIKEKIDLIINIFLIIVGIALLIISSAIPKELITNSWIDKVNSVYTFIAFIFVYGEEICLLVKSLRKKDSK